MKRNYLRTFLGAALGVLLGAALTAQAQPRFGGFGGFNNFNRNGNNNAGGDQYNNNGTVGSATISVDPATHNIIVIADKDTSEQIAKVIASLDAPPAQVLIKVAFVEVTDSKASAIGVQGAYTGKNGTFSQITGLITNYTVSGGQVVPSSVTPVNQSYNVGQSFNLPQALAGAAGSGGIYQILGSDFTATLQALATAGKAQVLSRPSILARDGQMAEIVIGQSVYLPSGVNVSTGVGSDITTINGTYQNVGIQLDVTPFIGANRLVQMVLAPQITSIDNSTPGQVIASGSLLTSPVFAPNINKRSANTVVVTPDGEPVVIGGLIASDKAVNESKVPLLGDIPLLGRLFKFKSESNQKNELLIFLTPHVVEAPAGLAGMSAHETSQMQMITNSVSERELDRYLDRLPVKKN